MFLIERAETLLMLLQKRIYCFSSNGEFQIFSSLQIKQEKNLLRKADKFCFIRLFTALLNQKP